MTAATSTGYYAARLIRGVSRNSRRTRSSSSLSQRWPS